MPTRMGVWGQTDVVIRWVDEAGEPACQLDDAGHTLHISTWMDGVAQHAVQGADLVVDESGISAWNGADRGVYTLEALPWAWTLVVDDAEVTKGGHADPGLAFQKASEVAGQPRSCGVSGRASWRQVGGVHPRIGSGPGLLGPGPTCGVGACRWRGGTRPIGPAQCAGQRCLLAGGSTRVLRTTFAVGRPRARAGFGVAHGARCLGVRHRVFSRKCDLRPQVLGPKIGLPRLVFSVGVGARGVVDNVGGTKGTMAQLGGHRPGGQPLSGLVLVLG